MTKYYLAIEEQFQNFFPVNNVLENNSPELIYDLKNIDLFTSQFINEEQLKEHLLSVNLIDKDEKDFNVAIYYIDGKNRKLFDGVCYKDDSFYINPKSLREIFILNKNDKDFLNQLSCRFKNNIFKNPTLAYKIFVNNILKINDKEVILDLLNYLNYQELRAIGFYIKNKTKVKEQEHKFTYSFKKE